MEELLRVWKEEASSDFEVEQKARNKRFVARNVVETAFRKGIARRFGGVSTVSPRQEDDLSRSTSQEPASRGGEGVAQDDVSLSSKSSGCSTVQACHLEGL